MLTYEQICKLDEKELKLLFDYNPDTGELIWIKSYRNRLNGKHAGAIDSKGRRRVEINGRTYAAHHICFAMYHGYWPKDQVDHRDQDKLNNRINNLREATNAENSRNRRHKRGGFKGVSFHKGRYIARIMKDGECINLGSFDTPEPASDAYKAAAIKYHGEFACLN